MVLIYSDTAMLVDLLFIQAKQTEEGKTDHFALSSLLKTPLLEASEVISADKLCVFRSISLHLLNMLL